MVNEFVLSLIPRDEMVYLSSDSSCQADSDVGVDGDWITVEFLNEIKCSRIPNHKIVLKKGFHPFTAPVQIPKRPSLSFTCFSAKFSYSMLEMKLSWWCDQASISGSLSCLDNSSALDSSPPPPAAKV
ncbi:unnamed protein product [Cuscuta campestris]|uniref:Uncharacterized protein n=1 Tax=Cuscuta campestris TaxID=132261 RepID=A0A484KBY8_9ASTE|nr:unnamed protein product [Cuscuta campestris]